MNGFAFRKLRTTICRPPTWYKGSAACHSPSPRWLSEAFETAAEPHRLSQVRGTAFERPVVPEVNMTTATAP